MKNQYYRLLCQSSGCDKSAQGSTNFCKAHGGGKRCLWGHEGSDHGAGNTPCERLARGKNGLCVYHNPQVDENRVHGGFSVVSDALSQGDRPSNTETSRRSIFSHPMEAPRRVAALADEGRVHGGNILSMFANGMSLGKHPANQAEASTSAPRNSKSTNGMVTGNSAARGSWL